MITCPTCGATLDDNAQYCPNCGTQFVMTQQYENQQFVNQSQGIEHIPQTQNDNRKTGKKQMSIIQIIVLFCISLVLGAISIAKCVSINDDYDKWIIWLMLSVCCLVLLMISIINMPITMKREAKNSSGDRQNITLPKLLLYIAPILGVIYCIIRLCNDMENDAMVLGVCACGFSLMNLIANIGAVASIKKGSGRYICPKCKRETIHNLYGVCSECGKDLRGDNLYFLILDIFMFPALVALLLPLDEKILMYIAIGVVILCSLFIIYPIYMYPAHLAKKTEHSAAKAIWVINFLFAETIIMWLILLIWASGGRNQSVQREMMESQTKALEELKQAYQTPTQQPVQQASLQDKLNELVALKQQGFLSEEEFEAKRQELISRI